MIRCIALLPTLLISFMAVRSAPVDLIRPDTPALPCVQKAGQLLDEVLNFMEKNYYRRDQVS